jgi:hypothetical protein
MKTRMGVMLGALGLLLLGRGSAMASCVVTNQTGFTFVVSSGNLANQQLKPHATTTVEAGKILGKTEDGRTISGSCRDGGQLVVKEKNGVPLLLPKK